MTATVLEPPAREVLLRLDDDTVARAARGEKFLDRGLNTILLNSQEWRANLFPPPGVFPQLAGLPAVWFDAVQEELRRTGETPSNAN